MTIAFTPIFGVEQTTKNDHAQLYSAPVYLIFRGSQWNSTTTQPYIAAATSLLSSPYLQGIQQYGSDGVAYYAGSTINGSPISDASNAVVRGTITAATYDGPLPRPTTPAHTPIYVVVTQNIGSSDNPGANGFNMIFHYHATAFGVDDIASVWVGGDPIPGNHDSAQQSLDYFTTDLGHEVGEIMSDYGEGGYEIAPGASWTGVPGNQIGDNEGNFYTARLGNGDQVQPLWSNADQDWEVTDGSAQQGIVLTPQKQLSNGQFDGQYALTIHGDNYNFQSNKFGAIVNDQVTIGYDGTNVVVTLNGEQAQFPASQITKIDVDTGQGQNSLLVTALPAGLAVNDITTTSPNSGTDAVTLGAPGGSLSGFGGVLRGVAAEVNLNRASPPGSLTLNDTGNRSSGGYYGISGNAITEYGQTIVTTANAGPTTINGLNGASTFYVGGNPSGQKLTLNTGTGSNTVNIQATSGPVTVASSTGTDNVVVGSGGSLASIAGAVSVSNSSGHDTITANDSANQNSDSFALTRNSIQWGGRTLVNYSETGYSPVIALDGGSGGNTINVNSTAAGSVVTVNTGGSTNAVNLHATGGPVTVNNGSHGNSTVTVGADGSLASIAGPVNITNSNESTDVVIDDFYDPTARTYVLNQAGFSGVGLPTVNIPTTIRSLTVTGGTATNNFEVDALPPVSMVNLYTNYSDRLYGAAAGKVTRLHKLIYGGPIILH